MGAGGGRRRGPPASPQQRRVRRREDEGGATAPPPASPQQRRVPVAGCEEQRAEGGGADPQRRPSSGVCPSPGCEDGRLPLLPLLPALESKPAAAAPAVPAAFRRFRIADLGAMVTKAATAARVRPKKTAQEMVKALTSVGPGAQPEEAEQALLAAAALVAPPREPRPNWVVLQQARSAKALKKETKEKNEAEEQKEKMAIVANTGLSHKKYQVGEETEPAHSNNEWTTDALCEIGWSRAKPKSISQTRALTTPEHVRSTRIVLSAAIMEAQKNNLDLTRERQEAEVAEVRARIPGFRLPTLVSCVASDGTPMMLGIPKDMKDLKGRGEPVVPGGEVSVAFEVVRRHLAWVGAEGISSGATPLICLPMALGRANAPTIFRAWELSDPLEGFDLDSFSSVVIVVDMDGDRANRKAVRMLEEKYRGRKNVLVVHVLCLGHQIHLTAKQIYARSTALNGLFAAVKIFRFADYKLRAMVAVKDLVKGRLKIVRAEPDPAHRRRALRSLAV